MNLSEKKTSALYAAITDPIMDERVTVQKLKHEGLSIEGTEKLDARLFEMQNEIWRRIRKVLNLQGPA